MQGTPARSIESTLLVVEQTHRPDALNGFRMYNGEWNLSSSSYFAVMQCNLL
jgi:hypothetical protein